MTDTISNDDFKKYPCSNYNIKDRITIRLNEKEKAELNYLMESFNVTNPSEALKLSVEWVNNYIKNVTNMFFPQSYDVLLRKKLKTYKTKRKVY